MDKIYHSQDLEELCVFLSLSRKIQDRAVIRVVRIVPGPMFLADILLTGIRSGPLDLTAYLTLLSYWEFVPWFPSQNWFCQPQLILSLKDAGLAFLSAFELISLTEKLQIYLRPPGKYLLHDEFIVNYFLRNWFHQSLVLQTVFYISHSNVSVVLRRMQKLCSFLLLHDWKLTLFFLLSCSHLKNVSRVHWHP